MSHGPFGALSNLTSRYADRTWFRVLGGVVTMGVFAAGLEGIRMAHHEASLLESIYDTCEFFLFHGDPSFFHQDTRTGIALVSVAAFIGPMLTAAVIALLVGQIAAVILDRQGVHTTDHVVILGCGREGIHWANYLHEKYPIVVVNRDEEGPQLGRAREISKALLIGDMTDKRTRERAAILESKMVVVCTGDELTNIDTAREIENETKPDGPMIFCRVVSQSLLFSMIESGKNSSSRIRYFNIYDFVANDAIQKTLKHDASNKPVHLIICGFGRFGQAVLHAAGQDTALFHRLSAVDIVDLHADDLLDEYKFSAPNDDDLILNKELTSAHRKKLTEARRSGILNHNLWSKLLAEPAGALRLVFICTDQDVTNLVHALAIQRLVERHRKGNKNIHAIVVMRQLQEPKHGEKNIVYATMSQSTDTQIAGLIAGANVAR